MMPQTKHQIDLVTIKQKTWLKVTPAYHNALGDEIKLYGAKWNAVHKAWLMPPINASLENLKRMYGAQHFIISRQVHQRWQEKWKFGPKDPSLIPKINQQAFERLSGYQQLAVQFLLNSPHPGSLLGFGPGVGKTFTALTAASGYKRVLMVTPFTLMLNMEIQCQELLGYMPTRTYKQGPGKFNWVVTNYDTVMRHKKDYLLDWDVIICDESILLKNKDASRTKAILEIRKRAPKVWLLSGSPISKFIDDLYAQFEIIYPDAFKSYWRFARTYCYVEETKWADKVTGNRPNIDYRQEFVDLAYIKDRREVLPQLPEMTFEDVHLEMGEEQTRIYNEIEQLFIAQLESGEEITAANKAVQLVRLQQAVSGPKNFGPEWPDVSIKTDALEELIETGSLELPAIIWTHWAPNALTVARRLALKFPDLKIGLTRSKDKERDKVIVDFANGNLDIIVMSMGLGKYGHTLINAKTMVYYDKTWDVDAYIQSLARVQRRGLKHSPHVISLKCPGTTDDMIEYNLETKSRSVHQLTNTDLATLLRGLNSVRHRV